MLLKVYYSSLSVVTACTLHWLIDDRSLAKTKLNRLINSLCFPVRSITKKGKHGNYSVEVHSEDYSTWYVKLHDGASPDLHVTALWTIYIVETTCIFCLIVLQTLISVINSTWLAFKICWRADTRRSFIDNFDFVLLNKMTYFLSSCPL